MRPKKESHPISGPEERFLSKGNLQSPLLLAVLSATAYTMGYAYLQGYTGYWGIPVSLFPFDSRMLGGALLSFLSLAVILIVLDSLYSLVLEILLRLVPRRVPSREQMASFYIFGLLSLVSFSICAYLYFKDLTGKAVFWLGVSAVLLLLGAFVLIYPGTAEEGEPDDHYGPVTVLAGRRALFWTFLVAFLHVCAYGFGTLSADAQDNFYVVTGSGGVAVSFTEQEVFMKTYDCDTRTWKPGVTIMRRETQTTITVIRRSQLCTEEMTKSEKLSSSGQ